MNNKENETFQYAGRIGDKQFFEGSDGSFKEVRLIDANSIPFVYVTYPVFSYYGDKVSTERVGPIAKKEDIDRVPTFKFPEAWWELRAFYEEPIKVHELDGSSCTAEHPIREGWFCSRCGYIVSETPGRPVEGFCGMCGAKIIGWRDKKGEVRKR